MVAALVKAQGLVSSNPLVVFSWTYCPYCVKVKDLLTKLGAKQVVVELDIEGDGDAIQSALAGWTGRELFLVCSSVANMLADVTVIDESKEEFERISRLFSICQR